jgi:hypothetical protein
MEFPPTLKVSPLHTTCFDQYGHHQVFPKLLFCCSSIHLVRGPICALVCPTVRVRSSCCVVCECVCVVVITATVFPGILNN